MKKIIFTFMFFLVFACTSSADQQEAIFYYGETCPHCKKVEEWMEDKTLDINIIQKEIYNNSENQKEFTDYCDQNDIVSRGVPMLTVGDEYIVGDTPIIEYLEKHIANVDTDIVTDVKDSFNDISDYSWKNSINYIQAKEIINGYADDTFKPNSTINRAELTKIMIKAKYGEIEDSYAQGCFTDVELSQWYAKYICFAKEKNILKGYSDGSFGVEKNITQPEALKIIFNTFGESVTEDKNQWYQAYLDYAENLGMYYFDKQNAPSHEITRGEFSYLIAWIITKDNSIERAKVDQISDF